MYSISDLKNMLFIDIETSTAAKDLEGYAEIIGKNAYSHWEKKAKYGRQSKSEYEGVSDADMYIRDAALYPEFGRVVVITIGQITFPDGITPTPKVKSFYGDDEKELLKEFMNTMGLIFNKNPKIQIVGHNIKGFDMPYLIKRSIIKRVEIPQQLHLQKLKPWENCLVDTNEIWKFGGWNGASLSMICDLLEIPSPKENMYGGEVSEAYYAGRLEEIKDYCEDDVIGTMNVLLRMSDMALVHDNSPPF